MNQETLQFKGKFFRVKWISRKMHFFVCHLLTLGLNHDDFLWKKFGINLIRSNPTKSDSVQIQDTKWKLLNRRRVWGKHHFPLRFHLKIIRRNVGHFVTPLFHLSVPSCDLILFCYLSVQMSLFFSYKISTFVFFFSFASAWISVVFNSLRAHL